MATNMSVLTNAPHFWAIQGQTFSYLPDFWWKYFDKFGYKPHKRAIKIALCLLECRLLLHLRPDSSWRQYFETKWQLLCKVLPFLQCAFIWAHLWVGPVALESHSLLRIRGLEICVEEFSTQKRERLHSTECHLSAVDVNFWWDSLGPQNLFGY